MSGESEDLQPTRCPFCRSADIRRLYLVASTDPAQGDEYECRSCGRDFEDIDALVSTAESAQVYVVVRWTPTDRDADTETPGVFSSFENARNACPAELKWERCPGGWSGGESALDDKGYTIFGYAIFVLTLDAPLLPPWRP